MFKYVYLLVIFGALPVSALEPESVVEVVAQVVKDAVEIIIEEKIPIPVHGNYCGHRHGDPTYRTPPIDSIDAACMKHDQCYDRHYFSCACDREFMDDLAEVVATAPQLNYTHFVIVPGIVMVFSTLKCEP